MHDNLLRLKFSATECNGWPKLKFYIDDDLYEDFIFKSPNAEIELPLSTLDGEHELSIELYDKTNNNTIIIDSKIISDQTVTLDKIFVDNVEVPNFIKYKGIHYYHGQEHIQSLTWGPNGVWKLKFRTPIISWILDEKEKISQDYRATATVLGGYNSAKKTKLMYYLKQIEEILSSND